MSKSMWALDAPKRIALLVWALGILVSLGLGWSTSSDNRQAADRRLAVGPHRLEGLPPGHYRELTA